MLAMNIDYTNCAHENKSTLSAVPCNSSIHLFAPGDLAESRQRLGS